MTRNRIGLAAYLRSHEHPGGIIVCEDPKVIYMKTTKTAGTSILRGTLQKTLPGMIHFKDNKDEFLEWINRITDEELEDYFIFTVVRNPWDRLVSVAAYFKIPIKDFIQNLNSHWKNNNVRVHSLPLSHYSHMGDSQFADHICRFECLQPDMNLVFDRIGISRQQLPYRNRSKHKHYSHYYSRDEIEKVQKIYEEDIRNFGYCFEHDTSDSSDFVSRVSGSINRIIKRFT